MQDGTTHALCRARIEAQKCEFVRGLLRCCADNLKLTFPTAAALFQVAWGIASLPGGGSDVNSLLLTEMRWGTDYLMACFGNSTLITQVGFLP